MTIKWFMVPEIWSPMNIIFVHFSSFFGFTHMKNQNFEKMEKAAGDTIILHMCATHKNHIMYGSWDMESDGHNICDFEQLFAH